MSAYYNEHDPFAAEWLRNLIAGGQIAPGEVDERDIRDVTPTELVRFTQCHFFAGIGIWSLALRQSGWPDDRPIWTGSCPCQPFSEAGSGEGFDDERHLWPAFHWLIDQCRPPVVVGEQVASKDGMVWLDLVSADMEASDYAFGATDLCAAGFGVDWGGVEVEWLERAIHHCPDPMVGRQLRAFADWAGQALTIGGFHIRQRTYFVGVADEQGGGRGERGDEARPERGRHIDGGRAPNGRLGDSDGEGSGSGLRDNGSGKQRGPVAPDAGGPVELVDGAGKGSQGLADEGSAGPWDEGPAVERTGPLGGLVGGRPGGPARAPDGGREGVDWLFCRDGLWRPVEAGTFPLANAASARVGKLRAYGNGLDAATATAFAQVVRAICDDRMP